MTLEMHLFQNNGLLVTNLNEFLFITILSLENDTKKFQATTEEKAPLPPSRNYLH